MHELSLSRAILATALDHSDGHRVVRVGLTVGALRQVVPESLAYYFEIAARGTACEGAELEQRLTPARMRCACGEEWELEEPSFRCPRCDGANTTVLDGDQLSVDCIEVEEEEVPCTARR